MLNWELEQCEEGGGEHVLLWENLRLNSKGNRSFPNIAKHPNSRGLELGRGGNSNVIWKGCRCLILWQPIPGLRRWCCPWGSQEYIGRGAGYQGRGDETRSRHRISSLGSILLTLGLTGSTVHWPTSQGGERGRQMERLHPFPHSPPSHPHPEPVSQR